MLKLLNKDSDTACVPGPSSELTGELPCRPMLFWGTARAALLIQPMTLLVDGYNGTPAISSARGAPIKLAKFTPCGSAPGATTVMNGPVWYSKTPDNCQSPTMPLTILFVSFSRRPFRPTGNS